MNYFEARGHERFFRRFKAMNERYWRGGDDAPTVQDFDLLRHELEIRAHTLGQPFARTRKVTSRDPRDLVPRHYLDVDSPDTRDELERFLDRCIGAAVTYRRDAKRKLLSPWWWPVLIIAGVIKLPVLVLREAGGSKEHEREWLFRFVQVSWVLILAALFGALGLRAVGP